jgi:hypothetical protein
MTTTAATEVKERPVLFSGPMVKAILEGRKSQTRRAIKPQPDSIRLSPFVKSGLEDNHGYEIKARYYPGDRLWCRETWAETTCIPGGPSRLHIVYRADSDDDTCPACKEERRWKPSIFMPRWASRITLEVVNVRVERLQAISEADAIAEGVYTNEQALQKLGLPADTKLQGTCVDKYRIVWESINGKKYPWASNPWVFVIEFKKIV